MSNGLSRQAQVAGKALRQTRLNEDQARAVSTPTASNQCHVSTKSIIDFISSARHVRVLSPDCADLLRQKSQRMTFRWLCKFACARRWQSAAASQLLDDVPFTVNSALPFLLRAWPKPGFTSSFQNIRFSRKRDVSVGAKYLPDLFLVRSKPPFLLLNCAAVF